jgi:hypothetical protein
MDFYKDIGMGKSFIAIFVVSFILQGSVLQKTAQGYSQTSLTPCFDYIEKDTYITQYCIEMYISSTIYQIFNPDSSGRTSMEIKKIHVNKDDARKVLDEIDRFYGNKNCILHSDSRYIHKSYICYKDVIDNEIGRINYAILNMVGNFCVSLVEDRKFVNAFELMIFIYKNSTTQSISYPSKNIRLVVNPLYVDGTSGITVHELHSIQGVSGSQESAPGIGITDGGNAQVAEEIYLMLSKRSSNKETIYGTMEFEW